jgi:cation diffusion facilitator family transporter
MASSKGVVIAALFANGAIAIMKFVGFLLTGSPSMLSETYHSISDTGNQVFLLIGIRYSTKERNREHPFGYGKAQFFYSFLVSVLLFGIAGWESAKHGVNAIRHPHPPEMNTATIPLVEITVDAVLINYAVLIGAIAFEAYAFKKAYANLSGQIEENDWSGFREAFRKTSDVTVLTAFTEDTIAGVGAGIALLGVFLTRETGDPIYDAVGALLIGLMLMGFALALAWENKRLLLGESIPKEDERVLRDIIQSRESVTEIVDLRTLFFGTERIIVSADIAFAKNLDADTIDDEISAIEDELMQANDGIKKVYIEPN